MLVLYFVFLQIMVVRMREITFKHLLVIVYFAFTV